MKLEKLIAEALATPEASLHDSTELRSIPAWDSMTHIVLITRLEESFGVQLSGDEIADMKTVGDARRFLRGHGVAT
jgi:acyl carrier protein